MTWGLSNHDLQSATRGDLVFPAVVVIRLVCLLLPIYGHMCFAHLRACAFLKLLHLKKYFEISNLFSPYFCKIEPNNF